MLTQTSLRPGFRFNNLFRFAFFAMVAVYLVNCLTPLRLHYDSIRYYEIKDCIEFGCPPDSPAATDYFPYGYTALLLILSKLYLLKSFSIVFVNSIYVIASLFFLYRVFEQSIPRFFFVFLLMINWLFIKFVTLPLSEMQYLFFSMGSLYFYYGYLQRKKIWLLLAAFLLCWVAFMTRTIGVALVAALVAGLLWEYRARQIAFFKKYKYFIIGFLVLVAGALILFAKPLGISHYTDVMSAHAKEAPFMKRMGWRFTEWGEVAMNAPAEKMASKVPPSLVSLVYITLGLFVFGWFVYTVYFSKNKIPFFIKAYILFYCFIMFNWPFYDPRFWVPLMPVVAACLFQAVNSLRVVALKRLSIAWLLVYIALGASASGYMIYTSFNKEALARTQAKGAYRNEYEIHFFGKPLSDTAKKIDPGVVQILNKYD